MEYLEKIIDGYLSNQRKKKILLRSVILSLINEISQTSVISIGLLAEKSLDSK